MKENRLAGGSKRRRRCSLLLVLSLVLVAPNTYVNARESLDPTRMHQGTYVCTSHNSKQSTFSSMKGACSKEGIRVKTDAACYRKRGVFKRMYVQQMENVRT